MDFKRYPDMNARLVKNRGERWCSEKVGLKRVRAIVDGGVIVEEVACADVNHAEVDKRLYWIRGVQL